MNREGRRQRVAGAPRPSPDLIGRRRKGGGRPQDKARAQADQGFPRRHPGGQGAGAERGGRRACARSEATSWGLLGEQGSSRNGWACAEWAREGPGVRVRVGAGAAGGGGS